LENSLLPDLLQEKWLSTIEENGKNPSQSSEATSMHTFYKALLSHERENHFT